MVFFCAFVFTLFGALCVRYLCCAWRWCLPVLLSLRESKVFDTNKSVFQCFSTDIYFGREMVRNHQGNVYTEVSKGRMNGRKTAKKWLQKINYFTFKYISAANIQFHACKIAISNCKRRVESNKERKIGDAEWKRRRERLDATLSCVKCVFEIVGTQL